LPAPARSAIVVLLSPGRHISTLQADGDAVERELQSIPGLSVGILSTRQGEYTPKRMRDDIDRAERIATAAISNRALAIYEVPIEGSAYPRLRSLVAGRRHNELIAIVERARTEQGHELVWSAVAGLDGGGRTLTSQTTRQDGMIAAMDLAPTLLDHLRLPVPARMPGRPIHSAGALEGAALRSLKARLEVIYPRRLPALACLLGAWALLLVALWIGARPGEARASEHRRRSRTGEARAGEHRRRSAGGDARLRWALRLGALAVLWTPVAVLVPAAMEPGPATEYASIVGVSLTLAALTDALLTWPRAPIAPAVAAVLALSVDALAGTQLLMRSLLGPNPAYGARFYGIGNELKPALAVLVFAAVAAAFYRDPTSSPRSRRRPIGDPAACGDGRAANWRIDRRSAAAMAGAGALLAAVEGSALIGAGVGGVILVCAGAAVASVLLLPGSINRRRALAALAAPLLGLALLAALDLATAHGAGHFTGSVLEARSPDDLKDLIARRYKAAWQELGNGLMPMATALALLLAAIAVRRRERVLAPVGSDLGWQAALAGGIVAGAVGALVEDSGPVLLVVAVFALACVLAYLWGRPPARAASQASQRKRVSTRTVPVG
jgi:hypothetical protein